MISIGYGKNSKSSHFFGMRPEALFAISSPVNGYVKSNPNLCVYLRKLFRPHSGSPCKAVQINNFNRLYIMSSGST